MRKLSSVLNSAFVSVVNDGGLKETPLIDAVNRSESPIEAQLMMHLMRHDFVIGGDSELQYEKAIEVAALAEGRICIFQQVLVGVYRTDFMFIRVKGRKAVALVVEADGKDWHYSGASQIKKDNERLAFFARSRIFTMRFLGSEIWKECEDVVAQIQAFFGVA